MTDPQPIDAPRPNHPTGPKTPEGKKACRLNAYRHGLTGQRRFNSSTKLNIITPDERQAYDKHSKINLEALAPATDYERDLAQCIADDRWRLKRARTIESGMFAFGMRQGPDNTGTPQVDDALAQSRTWMQEARSLQLLTIYEQRISRAVDKAIAQLESFQAKRKQAVKDDMRQAKLLMQLAQAEGRPYQPEAYFTTVPLARESVFSTPEVARELTREIHLAEATRHSVCAPKPTREQAAKAAAGESQTPQALAREPSAPYAPKSQNQKASE